MDTGNGGRVIHPPREEDLRAPHPVGYPPPIQSRIDQKDLERLVGKLRSIHLAVPGAVAHLFHIKRALNQGGVDRACLSPEFHCKLEDWKALALQVASPLTHLAEIVCRKPTHMEFYDASGLGVGGLSIDLDGTGHNMVWWHPWPVDVTEELVSSTKPNGTITNSDLELAPPISTGGDPRLGIPPGLHGYTALKF